MNVVQEVVMRIDAKLSLVAHRSVGREVKSVSGVHALKPLVINAYQAGDGASYRHHQAVNDDEAQASARQFGAERRKTCRRVRQQAILMELRSGGDRRHTLSEDAGFGHVDEQV